MQYGVLVSLNKYIAYAVSFILKFNLYFQRLQSYEIDYSLFQFYASQKLIDLLFKQKDVFFAISVAFSLSLLVQKSESY